MRGMPLDRRPRRRTPTGQRIEQRQGRAARRVLRTGPGRKPRGITMPVPIPLRRIDRAGSACAGAPAARRRLSACGHDHQPPAAGFGRAQQAEHGAAQMAAACDEGRPPSSPAVATSMASTLIQRLAILLDCTRASPSAPSSNQGGKLSVARDGRGKELAYFFGRRRASLGLDGRDGDFNGFAMSGGSG